MAKLFKDKALYSSESLREFKSFQNKSVKELREIAKERGIAVKGGSTKTEIISALSNKRGE